MTLEKLQELANAANYPAQKEVLEWAVGEIKTLEAQRDSYIHDNIALRLQNDAATNDEGEAIDVNSLIDKNAELKAKLNALNYLKIRQEGENNEVEEYKGLYAEMCGENIDLRAKLARVDDVEELATIIYTEPHHGMPFEDCCLVAKAIQAYINGGEGGK
jgi:hypothetical protein